MHLRYDAAPIAMSVVPCWKDISLALDWTGLRFIDKGGVLVWSRMPCTGDGNDGSPWIRLV